MMEKLPYVVLAAAAALVLYVLASPPAFSQQGGVPIALDDDGREVRVGMIPPNQICPNERGCVLMTLEDFATLNKRLLEAGRKNCTPEMPAPEPKSEIE